MLCLPAIFARSADFPFSLILLDDLMSPLVKEAKTAVNSSRTLGWLGCKSVQKDAERLDRNA